MHPQQTARYHPILVALHWVMAPLIIAALALGALVMAKLPNSDPMKLEALRAHAIGGASIGFLMLVRLALRTRTRPPEPARTGNLGLDWLARTSHRLFYVVVIGMAGSGIYMALQTGLPSILFGSGKALPEDFWVYPIRAVHYTLSRILMVLIVLHVLGVLYHTLIQRDGLLRRMTFGRRTVSTVAAPPMTGDASSRRLLIRKQ
jgi:cytochrome b561